jgi:mono/diheme cytochrome c family protein
VNFRNALIALNIAAFVVIAGVVVWRVFSMRRNPEDKQPDNIEKFLPDEDLEGRRLERVLGWSLIFTLVIAVALPVYFLFEPSRQDNLDAEFLDKSIARGEVLYANAQSLEYDATRSLLCADCHGLDGTGGSANFVLQPESDECLEEQNQNDADVPQCLPKQVIWSAPDLTLASLRFDRAELEQILTFGRPGTPMPAWGVASGKGVLNEQGISDLVNYLDSIATTSRKAQDAATKEVDDYKQQAADLVEQSRDELEAAEAALAELQADPETSEQAIAVAEADVAVAEDTLANAILLDEEAQGLTNGAILFRLNCARCHTKGWSYHVTEPARPDLPPLPPQGSGAYGPNLRDGSTLLQFPGEAGEQQQFDWVAVGVPPNNLYGQRGISSGRMPHFSRVLTDEQITAIVEYERGL